MNSFSITPKIIDPHTISFSLKGDLTSDASKILTEHANLIVQRKYTKVDLELSALNTINGTGLKHLVIFITQVNQSGADLSAKGLSNETKSLFELTYLNEIINDI